MPSQTDIDAFGNALADAVTMAEQTAPPLPSSSSVATLEAAMANSIRPHVMKKGFAAAFAAALDPPWFSVAATNANAPTNVKLGAGWFNKVEGWAIASSRRIPLLGKGELRGVVYTSGTLPTILTLPPLMLPAENELFSTVIDMMPAQISVWVDGTVRVWYAEATTRNYVSLSGISYDLAF